MNSDKQLQSLLLALDAKRVATYVAQFATAVLVLIGIIYSLMSGNWAMALLTVATAVIVNLAIMSYRHGIESRFVYDEYPKFVRTEVLPRSAWMVEGKTTYVCHGCYQHERGEEVSGINLVNLYPERGEPPRISFPVSQGEYARAEIGQLWEQAELG